MWLRGQSTAHTEVSQAVEGWAREHKGHRIYHNEECVYCVPASCEEVTKKHCAFCLLNAIPFHHKRMSSQGWEESTSSLSQL
jgi:hypothetical protein